MVFLMKIFPSLNLLQTNSLQVSSTIMLQYFVILRHTHQRTLKLQCNCCVYVQRIVHRFHAAKI